MSVSALFYPPDFSQLPCPIYLRIDQFATDSQCIAHSHPWGQLSYSASGVMELNIAGQNYLSPPQYALWIPPNVEHDATIHQAVSYQSAYIDLSLCHDLPDWTCILTLGPILKAILADFAARQVNIPKSAEDLRLAQVLLDQIKLARCSHNYLPSSSDPALSQLLSALRRDPACTRTMAEWAQALHLTERTLARRCQRDLGMSFSEWRQRLLYLTALPMLEAGKSVQSVALELGYSTSSAFISMFQRQAGTTPDQFRRQLLPS
jgi:AraC-like DNA-binding protein